MKPPCVIFEDDHLLLVNKPAGLNTHSPSPYAGEGLYEWLRDHEPRWANLAIVHRLDKETSGLIVFCKTPLANRSLTEQFTNRVVYKKYLLLTDRSVPNRKLVVKTGLTRLGDKYITRPAAGAGTADAQTNFTPLEQTHSSGRNALLEAEPLTGRTHQIRVHAADRGFPILGDERYGGTPGPRLCLHAAELRFRHPVSTHEICFQVPVDFQADPRLALRSALIEPEFTDALRLVHGASDGWPGWYVDRLGSYLLSQSVSPLTNSQKTNLARLCTLFSAKGAYHKRLDPGSREAVVKYASPQLACGSQAPARFHVLENGLQFALSFSEGYSVGLFLDQRDNRRRLLSKYIGGGFPLFDPDISAPEVLNTFSYTCGFSLHAAHAGARTTNLDLSKKYLLWGRENFLLNRLDPQPHDFIFGDVFDWMRRFHKKRRTFHLIILDPPTFSRSRHSGAFRTDKDYSKLAAAALPLLKPRGVLFASCNTAGLPAADFIAAVKLPIRQSGRTILQEHYSPQPADFPISREEPAYLKTCWFRLG